MIVVAMRWLQARPATLHDDDDGDDDNVREPCGRPLCRRRADRTVMPMMLRPHGVHSRHACEARGRPSPQFLCKRCYALGRARTHGVQSIVTLSGLRVRSL